MSRWEPNSRERLGEAALSLFSERGYAATTVEDIAARAGVTERTFFRHFGDKREVLFAGTEALLEIVTAAITNSDDVAVPFDDVARALDDVAAFIGSRRTRAEGRVRRGLLLQNPELLERELIKLATMVTTMAACLTTRGTSQATAILAAEAGMGVFKAGFDRWLDADTDDTLPDHVRAAFAELGRWSQPAPRLRR